MFRIFLFVYTVSLLAVPFSLACGPANCPCKNYKTLSDPSRHYSYGGGVLRDDLRGWYRFVDGAGTRMLDICLTMNKCNSACVGHLVGGHPTVDDGEVTRKVCFSCYNKCCSSVTTAKVKNCGSYFVYKLRPAPPHGRLRYCGE